MHQNQIQDPDEELYRANQPQELIKHKSLEDFVDKFKFHVKNFISNTKPLFKNKYINNLKLQ